MQRLIGVVVGIVVGAALAGLGIWLGPGADTAEPGGAAPAATTTTVTPIATTVPEPPWTDEGGIRFESTVVIVDDFEVDGATAVLDYRLVSLAESAGAFFGGAQLPSVLPDTWQLTTAGGTVVEAASDAPPANQFTAPEPAAGIPDSIRFATEDGAELADVTAVRITGWRVAVPGQTVVEMAGVSGASAELYDGTVIRLQTVIEQRTGAIIDFDLERPPDPWRVAIDQGFGTSTEFVGDGPGWGRASSTIGGIGLSGGITGFQLVWSEPTAPDVVRVRASLVSWEPIAGEVTVWSET